VPIDETNRVVLEALKKWAEEWRVIHSNRSVRTAQ
jgi:hypothetical protein